MPQPNGFDVVNACKQILAINDPRERRRAMDRIPMRYRQGVGIAVDRLIRRRQQRMNRYV